MMIGREHSRIWRTAYDVRLANSMTLQVGLVGTDGIVLASDRLLQHMTLGARSPSRTSKFLSGDGLICCWSGDKTAERTAKVLRDIKWPEIAPNPRDPEAIRSKLTEAAKSVWQQTTDEECTPTPGIIREVTVVLFGSQLWLVEVSGQPLANQRLDRVVSGDVYNTCRHFINKYAADCYREMSVKELIGLAAYAVLAAGEENPHGVKGLEIVVIPTGSEPVRLTPEHEEALEDRFQSISSCIRTRLTEAFEF